MNTIDYLSPTENPREDFNTPDLLAAFQDNAPDTPPNLRREYTIQNRLLNSYTTRAEDVVEQYKGMNLASRRELIEASIDELKQYDNANDLENALQNTKLQVGVLSTLDVANDKARDIQDGYNYGWHHARPVRSLEEAREIQYTPEYMDDIRAGYNKDEHTLKIGEITYDLDEQSLRKQFAEQFAEIESSAQYAYTQNPLFENVEFADHVNENGAIDYEPAAQYQQTKDEFGCLQIDNIPTETFNKELSQVQTNIQDSTSPDQSSPDVSIPKM